MKDYEELIVKYPKLYSYCKYIECDIGWYDLIDKLSAKLEHLITKLNLSAGEDVCAASQVKEKYGKLRFYMTTSIDEMKNLLEEAESKSSEICERCGGKASNKYNKISGWYFTKCKKCWEIDESNL